MGQDSQTRTVLREATGRGPASVLVEANDRLQDLRALLETAVSRTDSKSGAGQARPATRQGQRTPRDTR
jgi:hypothetical protein